jgi:hypothetical protein
VACAPAGSPTVARDQGVSPITIRRRATASLRALAVVVAAQIPGLTA